MFSHNVLPVHVLWAEGKVVLSETVKTVTRMRKRMRKLKGKELGCAKWMTNIRNERGKILVTVLSSTWHSPPPFLLTSSSSF